MAAPLPPVAPSSPRSAVNGRALVGAVVIGGAVATAVDLVILIVRSFRIAGQSVDEAALSVAGSPGTFLLGLVHCTVTGLVVGGAFAFAKARGPVAVVAAAGTGFVASEVSQLVHTVGRATLVDKAGPAAGVEAYFHFWGSFSAPYYFLLLVAPAVAAGVTLFATKRGGQASRQPVPPGQWGAPQPPFGQPQPPAVQLPPPSPGTAQPPAPPAVQLPPPAPPQG